MDVGRLETIGASAVPAGQSKIASVDAGQAEQADTVDVSLTRREILLVGALVVVAALLYAAGLGAFQVGTYVDDAHYVTLARALAAGKGYSLISYLDAPPELKFPPGFPLLLTPVAFFFPGSLDAFKIPSLVLTLASLPLWFILFRHRLPFYLAILTLGAAATNGVLAGSATLAMSEAPFLFFTSALFVLADRYRDDRPTSAYPSVGVAATLIALYFVRTVGIVFLISTIVYLLALRRFRHILIVVALFAVPFAVWTYHSIGIGGGLISPEYEQELVTVRPAATKTTESPGMLGRAVAHAQFYATVTFGNYLQLGIDGPLATRTVNSLTDRLHAPWLPSAVRLAAFLFVVAGFLRVSLPRIRYAEFATLVYCGALLAWTWPGIRFLQPVGPMLYLFLVTGTVLCVKRLPFPHRLDAVRIAASVLPVGIIIAFNVAIDAHDVTSPVRNRITDISIGTRWIADHTPRDSIVMGEFVLPQSLYTERKMVDFPATISADATPLLDVIDRASVDYVLISPPITTPRRNTLDAVAQKLEQELRAHPEKFQVVFEQPEDNVRVYRVLEK